VIEGLVGGAPEGVIEGHDCLEAQSRGTGRHEQKRRNCAFNALSASSISMWASTDPSQPKSASQTCYFVTFRDDSQETGIFSTFKGFCRRYKCTKRAIWAST